MDEMKCALQAAMAVLSELKSFQTQAMMQLKSDIAHVVQTTTQDEIQMLADQIDKQFNTLACQISQSIPISQSSNSSMISLGYLEKVEHRTIASPHPSSCNNIRSTLAASTVGSTAQTHRSQSAGKHAAP